MREIGSVESLLQERVDQLASLARLSEAIARAADVGEAYAAALDCLDATLSADRASVLLFDPDGVLRFKSWRGLSDEYRAATEGHTPWSPDTKDPAPVLVEDVAEEPSLEALRPVIEGEGIRSLGFFPLIVGDRLLGKFMVYFDSRHRFSPTEVRLAQAISSHIALEIGRRRAEDELRLHTTILEAQSDLTSEGILVVDLDGRVLSYNKAFVDMWQVPSEVVETRSHPALIESAQRWLVDPHQFTERVSHLYANPDETSRDELHLVDGRIFDRHTSPVRDSSGRSYGRIWFFYDVTERLRQEERAQFLARASHILGRSLDFTATLRRVAELAVTAIADICAVDVVDDGRLRQMVVTTADPSRWEEVFAARESFIASESRASGSRAVIETGEPQLIADIPADLLAAAGPRQREVLHAISPRSAMVVPLHARGRTFGAITFISTQGTRRYTEGDLEFARDLARRAALAADNGLLLEEEQRARDAAERLQTVTQALAGALTSQEIAAAIVREGAAALGAAAGWLATLDEDSDTLHRIAAVGYQPELESAYEDIPLDPESLAGKAVLEERPLWFASCDEIVSLYPALAGDYRESGFEAMAVVPLRVSGRSTGLIFLNFTAPKKFRDDEKQLLLALAAECGQALDRASLYTRVQERADAASALAHVGDGVFRVDLDECVTLWNRGAEVITGITAADAVGKHIGELFVGWEQIRPRIAITDVPLAFGRRPALPITVRASELWVAISGVVAGDAIVYAFRDVTEAEKLEKARRDFLATASHELRTPLAGVLGATKTLLHRGLDEDTKQTLLQVIDIESERLARILDDLLYASRLDAGKMDVELTSCNVVSVAQEVINLERARTPRNLTLTLQAPHGVPPVQCDETKLRQVLLNLIDNAIKYSPDGGLVTVDVAPSDHVVRISVSDRGLGIPASEHERIFEKFYRLDPELSRGVGGTGLGLYISREFVRRMSGRIWVHSVHGEGSTFELELPLAPG